MTQPPDDVIDEVRAAIRNELRKGFIPADEIVEYALDMLEPADSRRMRPMAEHVLRAEAAVLLREQAGWPAVTDCDRLDLAFQELERRGIVARQDFSCCQNCGSKEIWGEVHEAAEAGLAVRGHTYFHQQDTDRAVEGGGLCLAYGSMEDDGTAEIGREIVAVLDAHGLATEWDGSPSKRIIVQLDWKRRRSDL